MSRDSITEVLQAIVDKCTRSNCCTCRFNKLNNGCPWMTALTHWEVDEIVEAMVEITR